MNRLVVISSKLSKAGYDSMKNEIVYIKGPFDLYGEARDVLETDYCGEDGPYKLKEVRMDVWYIVSSAKDEHIVD